MPHELLSQAVAEVAGELARLGRPGFDLRETRDLQPRLRDALGRRLPGRVRTGIRVPVEHFEPRVGGFDIVVDRVPGRRVAWLAELKWSSDTRDKIFEAAWDAVKLALARHQHPRDVTRCWLVTGASQASWNATNCADLFTTGQIDVRELWTRLLEPRGPNSGRTVGEDLEIGGRGNMFVRAPRLSIEALGAHRVKLGDGDWEIRVSAVEPCEPWHLDFTTTVPRKP